MQILRLKQPCKGIRATLDAHSKAFTAMQRHQATLDAHSEAETTMQRHHMHMPFTCAPERVLRGVEGPEQLQFTLKSAHAWSPVQGGADSLHPFISSLVQKG